MSGEVAVLEWIRDRLASSLSETRLAALDAALGVIRGAASSGNLSNVADVAARASAQLRGA